MALKPCRECKKKVSTEAVTCPNCGVPNPTQKKTTVKPWGEESNNTQDTNTKGLRSNNLYVQCEKSFCKDSYKIIANPAFVDQKCKCCGNILHEVSTKEGEKYYIDNDKDFFAKRYVDDFFTNELNPTNHYARCETSSCNQKYDLVVNPIFVDQKCIPCGNILHKVSKKDAEKYIKDIPPNSNKNENTINKKENTQRSSQSTSTKIEQNLIERIWQGNESLAVIFWLYCILTMVIVGVIAGAASAFTENISFALFAIVLIWTNTGLWRSSEKYKSSQLKNNQSYGWGTAAKVYVVLSYISSLSQLGFILRGF